MRLELFENNLEETFWMNKYSTYSICYTLLCFCSSLKKDVSALRARYFFEIILIIHQFTSYTAYI